MKQTFLWLAIGLITMALASCESKEEIIDKMEKEVSDMRQNVDTYTFSQWESAQDRFSSLYEDLKDEGELTNEERQRVDKIVSEAEKYIRAAVSVQKMRNLWAELQEIVMTCTKEEAADFVERWRDTCREVDRCELSAKQKEECMMLNNKIGELGTAPLRTDF